MMTAGVLWRLYEMKCTTFVDTPLDLTSLPRVLRVSEDYLHTLHDRTVHCLVSLI